MHAECREWHLELGFTTYGLEYAQVCCVCVNWDGLDWYSEIDRCLMNRHIHQIDSFVLCISHGAVRHTMWFAAR